MARLGGRTSGLTDQDFSLSTLDESRAAALGTSLRTMISVVSSFDPTEPRWRLVCPSHNETWSIGTPDASQRRAAECLSV